MINLDNCKYCKMFLTGEGSSTSYFESDDVKILHSIEEDMPVAVFRWHYPRLEPVLFTNVMSICHEMFGKGCKFRSDLKIPGHWNMYIHSFEK